MIKKILLMSILSVASNAETVDFWKYKKECNSGKFKKCILAGNELALEGNYYKAKRFYGRGCYKGDKNACVLEKASSKIFKNSKTFEEDKMLVTKLIKDLTIESKSSTKDRRKSNTISNIINKIANIIKFIY